MQNAGISFLNQMKRISAALLVALWLPGTVAALEIDTTEVRKNYPKKESLALKILKTPQYLIVLPVRAVESVSQITVASVMSGRVVRRVGSMLISIDRVWGFYPVVGYGSNSGLEGGLEFTSRQVFTKGERFKIKASYSTHDYQDYQFRYAAPSKFGPVKRPWVTIQYNKRPWESFYGLGNESHEADEVAFTTEETFFGLGWHHRVAPRLRLEFEGSYRIINLYDGEDPDLEGSLRIIEQKLGLAASDLQATRAWSVGGVVTHDWRNHLGRPTGGGYEMISVAYHKGVDRSDRLEYLLTRFELRHFLNIYKARLFALRLRVEAVDRMNDSPYIPFYLRPSLGGRDGLQGYRRRRFTDNNLALASLEYRYPIWEVVDAFLFIEEGRVFNSLTDDFKFRGWEYSFGGGIRIWNREGIILHTAIARSDEGTRFYLEFSEEF